MKRTQSEKSFRISKCRACTSPDLKLWFSLGQQPPANNLLENPTDPEDLFPLDVVICQKCGLVQLLDVVDPEFLFGNYVYYSSTATSFIQHFEKMAKNTFKKLNLKSGDLVVDIGSNDGILLLPFKKLGANVMGIEPAKHIAKVAIEKGVPTINEFFTVKTAKKVLEKTKKKAKVVAATNVFAHIYGLDEVVEGVKEMLNDDGIFIIENPYLWEMIKQGSFDLVYHEHLFYYDLTGISTMLKAFGMKLIDYQKVPVHGGSIRYFASKNLKHSVSIKVTKALNQEKIWRQSNKFEKFSIELNKNKVQFLKLMTEFKDNKQTVVGYGAPAKASTILNYYQVGPDFIKFIVDDSPAKQNKYLPGVHIPIKATEKLFAENPDCVVILAWNFTKPITERLRNSGYSGKILTPFII